jgi:hypothetical protein
MDKYNELKESGFIENADIRIRHQSGVKEVEWCEGVRLDMEDIPTGKHAYQTRHADNGDWCTPVAIAPECDMIRVNFCGTIISDEPIEIEEETKMMFLGKIEDEDE